MKIFLDSAIIEELKEVKDIIDGVTTNPTLVAKSGKKFKDVVNEITKLVNGPISIEAVSEDTEGMVNEAKRLSKIHKNIVMKIPLTSDGLKAIKKLSKEKIKTNATLVFSANQALLAAKAGATYVSPFVGRLDDQKEDGMHVVEEIMKVFKNYNFKTKVIVASIRNTLHVKKAAMLGADIATVPFKVLKEMIRHPLTDNGIKKFLEDWKKIPK